jgi:hypothetical protein
MGTNRNKIKNRLAGIQLFLKLFLGLIIGASPGFLLAQELTQNAVSNGAGLVSGGNYTGYASAGQMATYMYANGTQIATQGIILNEISSDVEFTFELSGTLTENENLKSGALRMKSAAAVAAGPPLAFVNIYLIDEETETVLFQTQTDANGYFQFKNIPYKNYYFALNEPVIPTEPILLTFKGNIFIKEVEISGEVGTEGITTEVIVTPQLTSGNEVEETKLRYIDKDKDGFGYGTTLVRLNINDSEIGYSENNIDCNDNDADINPEAEDIPGIPIDYNCDGEIPCNSFELTEFIASAEPVIITDEINVSVLYVGDLPSTAEINWGDGTSSPATISAGLLSGTHLYNEPGVYILTLNLTDGCRETRTFQFRYVVIYDPSEGFVTGSGTILSPVGASTLFPNVSGIASFGFVSKYDKKKLGPKGNTEFEFDAGDLKFVSTEYEWLVVAGLKAKFKGRGSVNGIPGYQFMISAIDGDTKGNPDLFRIKIWNETTGDVVYDNQMDAELDADPTTAILEGSIKTHTPKTKSDLILTSTITDNSNGENFTVYPNPTTGRVKIKGFQTDTEYLIKLTDMTGREVEIKKNSDFETEIDLTSSPRGIYNLVIQFDNENQTFSIIRQ